MPSPSASNVVEARGESAVAAMMERFRAVYGLALEWIVGALVVILAVEVTIGVVFRFSGSALAWYDELASVLLAWLTFYGSALASVKRAHIGCPELVQQLPWPARRAVNILAQLLVIAFFVILGYVGFTIWPILATESMISLPSVSMAVVQSVIPISAILIVVAELTHLVDLFVAAPPATSSASASLADGLH